MSRKRKERTKSETDKFRSKSIIDGAGIPDAVGPPRTFGRRKESSKFGIAHVPPVMAPVRAKPQVFDIAFNFFEECLPSLAARAEVSQTSTWGAGNGSKHDFFGWLRG